MADIKWLPDGQEAFEKLAVAIPEEMRDQMKPKLVQMLAGKAAGEPVGIDIVRKWVEEDLPEPQKSVFLAILGPAEAAGASEEEWQVTGKVAKPEDLAAIAKQGMELLVSDKVRITVGAATCGLAKGSAAVAAALKEALEAKKLDADVVMVGSSGMSYAEPVVDVIKAGAPRITYGNVAVDRVEEIVDSVASGGVVEDLVLMKQVEVKNDVVPNSVKYADGSSEGTDFYDGQKKLLTRNVGTVAPGRIEESIAMGAYAGLAKALSMKPADVVKQVQESKIRGRGGAGFPAGIKWDTCGKADGDVKYIVANGSEGDPEIGMHKSYIESDPHALIEGMAIAGYAVGAKEGYVYMSAEYGLGVKRVETAIAQAETMGLLGDDIMGSGFSFKLNVKKGGGAYICGEETALLNSLEGLFGEPRLRPPLPVEKGLFGKPTVVNNIETLSNVPMIVLKGGKWFAGIGTKASTGTKILALSGNVANPCWVEVPMGTKVKAVIDTFGKGTDSGKEVKAFQTGGPSGGILPASALDIELDYDKLGEAGSLLGSGGLLVMDEDVDVVDMARFLTEFFAEESCGKCTPCREGLIYLNSWVANLADGRGTKEALTSIEKMGEAMGDTCFCALGKTAAAPIISVMKHFPLDVERKMIKPIN
jgi:NADH:ubiquinone oxidoreductase subunit F (NADH-binding)/(2Fe-2S) ferredoxin